MGMIIMPALIPEIDVTDLGASLSIYRNVFDFEVLIERVEDAFAYLALGQAHLMMQQANGPGRRFRTAPLEQPHGRGLNLQILTQDVDGILARARKIGLEIVLDIEEVWYRHNNVLRGNRQFVVSDLDGYLLRFYEDLVSR